MNIALMTPDANAIGRRIRELRRRQNMTQAELAEKVSIRTGPLNTLENGHHLPSLPVLCRLAKVLGVDVNLLLEGGEERYVVRETQEAYGGTECRTEPTFSARASDYAASRARIIRFNPDKTELPDATVHTLDGVLSAFLALEDICGVQKQAAIPLTLKLPATESGLQRFTVRVRGLLGIGDAVIFDYLELLENAGLRIIFMPLPEAAESVSCYDQQSKNAFLVISTGITVERQIFRLCYELGRIYLFNGGMSGKRKIGGLDAEHAARRFAAYFLMPEEAVSTSVRQTGVEASRWTWEMLLRLKHRFGVSAEAFLYRLGELELISPALLKLMKSRIYEHYASAGNTEPDASRRQLTPNGRLGDLLLCAEQRKVATPELQQIVETLKKAGVQA